MGRDEKINPFQTWKRESEARDTEIFDRFGRIVQRGDLVQVGTNPMIWQVVQVKPDFRPGQVAPPGVTPVILVLSSTHIETLAGGNPVPGLIKVADYTETELYKVEAQQKKEGA